MNNYKVFKCYGTFNSTECKQHRNLCSTLNQCSIESNMTLGVCDCKYKSNCLYTKQQDREKENKLTDNVEDCPHYKMKENLLSD